MKKTMFRAGMPVILFQLLLSSTVQGAETPTQGQFAIKFAEKLGHAKALDEEQAIKLLSDLSIYPNAGPKSRWEKDNPATTQFVAEIQASVQILIKQVAQDLDISPPPTLDLYVFELPPAPQRAFFPAPADRPPNSEPSAKVSGGGQTQSPVPFSPPPPPGHMPENAPSMSEPPPLPASPPETDAIPSRDTASPPGLGTAAKPDRDPMIDNAVISALSAQHEVPVIIQLRPPQGAEQQQPNERLVAASQRAVLDTLSSQDFRLKHQYETIFSLSGWITKSGLAKLTNNPNVSRITLDGLAAPH
jgi:hypothetical protein